VATNWLSDEELATWKGFTLMSLQLTARLSRSLAEAGLSFQDYAVLASLSDEPDGRKRIVELGRELGWEKSRVSHHVTRMVARGLVRKERCSADQRGAWVVLSDQGRAESARVAPRHVAEVRDLFIDRLSPAQLATVRAASERVLAHLDELGCDE
jgi:DNA-binding MarR family transcriptional regulator